MSQPSKLVCLGLYHTEINHIINAFMPRVHKEPVFRNEQKNDLIVRIMDLNHCYFAKLNCDYLGDIENKELFIEQLVTDAIQSRNLASKADHEKPLTFKEIAIGGVISGKGRSHNFQSLLEFFNLVPDNHAYTVFKMPGEDKILIEDPRTGAFSGEIKLQSRTNNQICSFAASAIFYFCYRSLHSKDGVLPKTTQEILKKIYTCPELKKYMQEIENKIGTSETKKQVIEQFIKHLPTLNAIVLAPPNNNQSKTESSPKADGASL